MINILHNWSLVVFLLCAALGVARVTLTPDGAPAWISSHIGEEVALEALTQAVKGAGVDALIVHARKAWLAGLSPRENRDIPPLDYDLVYRLKAALRGEGPMPTTQPEPEIPDGLDPLSVTKAAA